MVVSHKILVFDSGLGGLTVLRQIQALRPDLEALYLADDAVFPYGELEPERLVARVCEVIGASVSAYRPSAIVIACNTASTLVLPPLRQKFDIPVVGTVPAIKPACAASRTRQVSVLATPGTISREYTRELITRYGDGCTVTLVGSRHLAAQAERHMRGDAVDTQLIREEIRPCFTDTIGMKTDTIVLACTHYPLLLDVFQDLAPWPVTWVDPSPAIARRVSELLPASENASRASSCLCLTSNRGIDEGFRPIMRDFGFKFQKKFDSSLKNASAA